MWQHQQVPPGYPYQQRQQQPLPLNMAQNPPQQQYYAPQPQPQPQMPQYQQPAYDMPQASSSSIPPSPREEAGRDKDPDYSNLPGPEPTCNEWMGYVYVLEWVQQPVRARMCGFGDKDRRPISPPPCIRLRIFEKSNMRELDPNKIDISFFVLTVDLWDKEGLSEKNLVKHNQVSPSISTSTTTAYPHTTTHTPQTHVMPQPFNPAHIPNYQGAVKTEPNTGYVYPSASNDANPSMYANRYADNRYNGPIYGGAPNGYGMPPSNVYGSIPPISTFQTSSPMPSPYSQSRRPHLDEEVPPQTTGMFTRNLIGSLTTSASLLKNESKDMGVWFILQDLSVRTEDWFRLKASFINLGDVGNSFANPSSGPSQMLTKGTAPVLATIFSKPFQVFSAKKFPGVIESTELSKTFANQGVKIPIRKENGGKGGRSNNNNNNDDDDEDGE